ncbi:NAD-dependent epimerase/dehydratase family protein [Opitutaceae bacterium]|nr:NAD-dependent epimerase/dehydratase family protein [Opitutaceae bacterium]
MNDMFAQRFLTGVHLVVLGAGYIGGCLAGRAVSLGAKVTILTRNATKAAELSRLGCRAVIANLESADWHDQIAGADFVLNSVSAGGGGLVGYQKSYLEGARSILHWGSQSSSKATLVYTGSTSVYPQGDGVIVSEDDSVKGDSERSRILIQTENLIEQWPGKTRVMRLAGIYGPERHYLLDQLRAGEDVLPGSGKNYLNLIHRDDAVSAIFAAFRDRESSQHRVFNVVDDGRARKAEIVAWLADSIGVKPPVFDGSAIGLRRANPPDRIISNQRIKKELDWSPSYKTYREGYRQILGT